MYTLCACSLLSMAISVISASLHTCAKSPALYRAWHTTYQGTQASYYRYRCDAIGLQTDCMVIVPAPVVRLPGSHVYALWP